MINVLFVCHGNICRSPMAEYILKDLVTKKGINKMFHISSAATSTEEIWNGIGNPVYPPVKAILNNLGIDCSDKRAVQIKKADYDKYDYIIGMDSANVRNINRVFEKSDKTYKLLDFANLNRDVSDPWYSRDFQKCYEDILTGCNALLSYLGY